RQRRPCRPRIQRAGSPGLLGRGLRLHPPTRTSHFCPAVPVPLVHFVRHSSRMALALVSRRAPRPHSELRVGRSTLRFYHGDCTEVLPELEAATIGVVVTSPPYNLGIKYRTYKDDLTRREYLNWTDRWIRAVTRLMAPKASLFLNVGAKPTDPWVALEVAQVARRRLKLQNTIHWVKSIAIDREAAGAGSPIDRDVAVGHYKPINSDRFVNDCHEYIFHFTPGGKTRL